MEISRIDWYSQMHRQLNIDFRWIIGNKVRWNILNLSAKFPQSLTIKIKFLRSIHRIRQLNLRGNILQLQESNSLAIILNFLQLHNLKIIINSLDIKLKRTHIDYIRIIVLEVKDPSDFGTAKFFKIFEFIHVLSIHDMNLVMLFLLD